MRRRHRPLASQQHYSTLEEYRRPPSPRYIAFSGIGEAVEDHASQPLERVEMNIPLPIVLIELPTTNIMIRFHNGKSKSILVNIGAPVNVLYEYVEISAPVNGFFQLVSGFPPKPLENMLESIEEAGLVGSIVIQKLI